MHVDMSVHRRLTQLDLFGLAALACYLIAITPALPIVVTGGAGVILCFALVGAVWATAILPPGQLPLVRLVAATAVVFGSGIAGGMLLNLLPSGLTRLNWLTYGLLLTGAGYLVARLRQHTVLFDRYRGGVEIPSRSTLLKLTAAAALVLTATVLTATSNEAKDKDFTELWLVPGSELNSPVRAIQATVGVRSHESDEQVYTLLVDSGTREFTARVNLAPGEEWTHNLYIEGDEAKVDLFRGTKAEGEPYRTVWVARR